MENLIQPKPIRLKYRQGLVFRDPHRFLVLVTGRRWGKTTTALSKLFTWAYYAGEYHGGVWGYFAPTYKQAKLIAWDILKQVIPPQFRLGRPNESELFIRLKNGHPIRLFGMDKPESLYGVKLLGGVGDERDQWKPKAYDEVLRPALSDTVGSFIHMGNPDASKRFLKELYDEVGQKQKLDPKCAWGRYHFKSTQGGYIPPEEIEEARKDLDERTFKEQYEASFLDPVGQVYYAFSDANLVTKDPYGLPTTYNPKLPLRLFWDFNVNPFCVGAAHFYGRKERTATGDREWSDIHVHTEFRIPHSNTVEMAHVILNHFREHRAGVIIYGDSAGNSKSTKAALSDYQIIMDVFKNVPGFQIRVKDANPHVKDRINAVNSKLKSYDGKLHTFIHPSLKWLPKDFINVRYKEGTSEIDKTDLEITHMSDAFGYMSEYEFPVIKGYVR